MQSHPSLYLLRLRHVRCFQLQTDGALAQVLLQRLKQGVAMKAFNDNQQIGLYCKQYICRVA